MGKFTGAISAIGSKVLSSAKDTVSDVASLAQVLNHLPKPAPEIDLELYTALQDAEAVACLEAFQVKQAAWLDAERRLAESANDPDAVTGRMTELQAVSSLAKEVELDDKPLHSPEGEAATLAAEAGQVERTIALGRRLAEAFEIAITMTGGTVRKLLAGAKHAASLSHDLRSLRHIGLFDERASGLLVEADARAQTLHSKMTPLTERLAFGLDGQAQEWRGHAPALRGASVPSRLWRRNGRAAKRPPKGLPRAHVKPNRLERAAGS